MSHTAKIKKSNKLRRSTYDVVAETVLAMLEKDTVPWRMPWNKLGVPINGKTGKGYRGINAVVLGCMGGGVFVTFKQAQALGGRIKKGTKGLPVVFCKTVNNRGRAEDEENTGDRDGAVQGGRKTTLIMKHSTVFHVATQTENVKLPPIVTKQLTDPSSVVANDVKAMTKAQEIISRYINSGPTYEHSGEQACYNPTTDTIAMPKPEVFHSAPEYFSTAFHEATHSTGHKSRLQRDLKGSFGDHSYSEEELVAEFGACFLCSEAGIQDAGRLENSAAYIASWKAKLKDDPKILVRAASAAQRAADLILGKEAPNYNELKAAA